MKLKDFNSLNKQDTYAALKKCCGSSEWIKAMGAARPFVNIDLMHIFSDKVWERCTEEDYLEAFKHHPQIGDVESLKKKFSSTAAWAGNEQHGTSVANDDVLQALKQGNDDYLTKFGFIFIVCATGKSAQQMLDILNQRLPNDRITELQIAAAEQNKITHIRLNKLLKK
jgi:2-oxo-4-hydroxy-4-carboxy-5-ureidoimidazoline decarboxylase